MAAVAVSVSPVAGVTAIAVFLLPVIIMDVAMML